MMSRWPESSIPGTPVFNCRGRKTGGSPSENSLAGSMEIGGQKSGIGKLDQPGREGDSAWGRSGESGPSGGSSSLANCPILDNLVEMLRIAQPMIIACGTWRT